MLLSKCLIVKIEIFERTRGLLNNLMRVKIPILRDLPLLNVLF